MKCPRCQRINSSKAKFCFGCGGPLQTAGPPALSYAELKSALNEALEQQIATSEILRVISGSPTELQPVLDTIAATARRLCDALDAAIMLRDGESFRIEAHHEPLSAPVDQKPPLNRRWVTGRAVLDGQTLHVPGLLTEHVGESGFGDVWTWVAIDMGTQLVPSCTIGRRDGFTAEFIRDLADRLASRVQPTSDGHKAHIEAVEAPSATQSITRYSSRCTRVTAASTRRPSAVIRQPPAPGRRRSGSPATRTRRIFARHSWSARTSRCGCKCGVDPAEQCFF